MPRPSRPVMPWFWSIYPWPMPLPPSWFGACSRWWSEVAAVGYGGLQINEPGTARSLKNLPGSWSDLALACLIHVGMKQLTPDQDSGLGIEAEYQEAVRLHASR
jgi:hypothetical protein